MKDKPSKHPDIYHTCYSLSGMSISQNLQNYKGLYADDHTIDHNTYTGIPKVNNFEFRDDNEEEKEVVVDTKNTDHEVLISAIDSNSLVRINPIYNGRFDKLSHAREYFRTKL